MRCDHHGGGLVRAVRSFPATPESVREARHVVMATLIEASCTPDTIEVARLLVSELVTNVLRHARSESVTVEVVVHEPAFRVAVHDEDPAMPQPRDASAEDLDGRGLALVDMLAERWAAEQKDPKGKVTWFELACA